MKTQIQLSSFIAASFEVLPVVIPWRPELTHEPKGDNLIDWLAGLACRQWPARRLPGSPPGGRMLPHRILHLQNWSRNLRPSPFERNH